MLRSNHSTVHAAILLSLSVPLAAALAQNARSSSDAESAKLIEQVKHAYREAPALTDEITFEVLDAAGQEVVKQTYTLTFGERGESKLDTPNLVAITANGKMHVHVPGRPTRVLQTELGDNPIAAWESAIGTAPWQHELRWKDGDIDFLAALGRGLVENVQVTAVERNRKVEGGIADVLTLTGAGATGTLEIDPQTHFIERLVWNIVSDGSKMLGSGSMVTQTFNPKRLASLPEPITFEVGDRHIVKTMGDLQSPILEGESAPDFTLKTLAGEEVTLSDLRGSVVVLDFWATWCGPCKRGLPLLEEFAKSAASTDQPIKVFALNTMENGTASQVAATVTEYWTQQKFTVPTLLDANSATATAYGVRSIPFSVVIDPHGTVHAIHVGYSSTMVEMLQRDAESALQAKPRGDAQPAEAGPAPSASGH